MDPWIQIKPGVTAVIATVAAVGLVACNQSGDPPVPAPKVNGVPATASPPASSPDTTPKASDVFKEGAPPDKTSTNARPVDPSRPMTTQEETMAMPMPGQANDHSNPAAQPVKR